jgi:hypothetical protein
VSHAWSGLRLRRWGQLSSSLLVCILLLLPRRAEAWNARGHMLVALIAYDALPEPQRAALVRLLEAHPRFREDIASHLPAGIDDEASRARWIFAQAATWPDLARGQPEYEHGTWHYINWPLELRRDEVSSCREAQQRYPESVRRSAELDAARRAEGKPGIPAGDALPVALENNRRTLNDLNAPAPARALALSWLLHLVADAHQPLHGVALFTRTAFATGDRGGNDVLVSGRGSLHRVWDELLGQDTGLDSLDLGVRELRRERGSRHWRGATARELDVRSWLFEDCEVARRAVYVPAILSSVGRFERGAQVREGQARGASSAATSASPAAPAAPKPEVSLRAAYFEHATQTARDRALRAGLRLAALLTQTPF